MAALTEANLTPTRRERWIVGRKRFVKGIVSLVNTGGVLTYPTGGIPVGTVEKWGFVRAIDTIKIIGTDDITAEYVYGYDPGNKKLLVYEEEGAALTGGPLPECDASETPTDRTLTYHAIGW